MTQREEFALKYGQHSCATVHFDNYGTPYVGAIECLMANTMVQAAWWGWKAAKAQAVPQWIPIGERLPEHKDGLWSDPVIAMTDTGNIYRLSYCGGWQRTSEFVASGSSKVTHWMPLPAAPEQNK